MNRNEIFLLILIIFWVITILLNLELNQRATDNIAAILNKGTRIEYFKDEFVNYLSMMKDAETGARGFTITGEEIFLEPYNNAVKYLNNPKTRQLFIEAEHDFDPIFKEKLIRVQELQKLKMDQLEQVIDIRRNEGLEEAEKIFLNLTGKKWLDEIRVLIAQVNDELSFRRREVDKEIKVSVEKLNLYKMIGSFAYIVLSSIFILKLFKEMNSVRKYGQALFLANQERDFVLKSAEIGTGEWDLKTEKIQFNDEFYEIVHASPGSIPDYKTFLSRIHPEDLKGFRKQIREALDKRISLSDTFRLICPDGKIRHITGKGRIFFDLNNTPSKISGVLWDVTDRYMINMQKDEFISMVSHEMRTPLASIQGAIDLILARKLSAEEIKELLENAKRNAHRLSNIVNDIIDVERAELGRMEFFLKKIQIRPLVLEAIGSYSLIAEKKEIKILADENLPDAAVYGDYIRLLQVMTNLLSNAVKFSSNNTTIKVMIEVKESSVQVSVQDQGIGIPENLQNKIFNKFVQLDTSGKGSSRGTGLGLFICKTIIERLKGKMGFVSKEGKGSTFFFEIPLFKE